MTRLRGASVSSYEVSHGGGIERSQIHRSKLPQNAPEVIAENTVDVSDPTQVFLWCRDERRRHFNILVRRYKTQLLYGCQDPGCHTPTCASYRRRMSEGPYRRYTELSARTLACYLASLDNADAGLCRNTSKFSSELSSHDPHRRSKRRVRALPTNESREGKSPGAAAAPTTDGAGSLRPASHDNKGTSSLVGAQGMDSSLNQYNRELTNVPEDEAPATQHLKDPKSFTQNLFDTLSLRMIEWLPLRRPPSHFDASLEQHDNPNTHSPKPEARHSRSQPLHKSQRSRDRTFQQNASLHSNPHTPSSRSSGPQTTAVELKLPNQQIKRLSLTEIDQWRQSPRSSLEEKTHTDLKPARKLSINTRPSADEIYNIPSPPALKHRPQKHRGRTDGQRKKERRVSWDGAKLLNDVERHDGNKYTPAREDQPPSGLQYPTEHKAKRQTTRRKRNSSTIQSLSHLTGEIIDGLGQVMATTDDEAERWKDELAYIESYGTFDDFEGRFSTPRQREVFTFVAQSVFFALGSTKQILRSFRQQAAGPDEMRASTVTHRLNVQQLQPSLRKLFTICPKDIVFHSLWSAVETLFIPPKDLSSTGRQSRRSSCNSIGSMPSSAPIIARRTSDTSNEHLNDECAADVATVAFFALACSLPDIDTPTWRGILQMRATGAVTSNAEMQKLPLKNSRLVVETTDILEHELALRLVGRLVRALTARLAFHEISKTRPAYRNNSTGQRRETVLDLFINNLSQHQTLVTAGADDLDDPQSPSAPSVILEYLRTILLKEWDGNLDIPKGSTPGGAVQILSLMYKEKNRLGLVPEDFHTPFLSDRVEPMDMPVEWLERQISNKRLHLLSYSFLFPPSALVIYFRSLNYAAMSKCYEAAMTTTKHVIQTAFGAIQIQNDVGLLARMKTSMTTYLVLEVRRDNVLTDALNQLWRRERRELMRPLKVQMGMNEGEEGLDHGGVQQEFFRVLMAEALDPTYGMFTMDNRTRTSWFQPCPLEPLYKFELLGLFMSLAVYNGLTLPVTFPTAFYRKLLGLKVKQLDHIRDGWPELTKGLEGLLAWQDGDVGDIFMRTYEFSFEAFGSIDTVDMQKVDRDAAWPPALFSPSSNDHRPRGYSSSWSEVRRCTDNVNSSPPSSLAPEVTDSHVDIVKSLDGSVPVQAITIPDEEASLVTNGNRVQFVKDYIFWLTDKSIRAQFEAFARGFYTCLDRSSLSIFTPDALKTVVEGIQEIDVDELEQHARYEGGFGPSHQIIRDFWNITRQFSAEKKAQLLEFVTASDRVPVNGISSIMFVIQKNGVDDVRLPTSLTCFGRLLLPEYSSKSVLESKLNKALENARGFGVA
ncbi:hypothetical protein FE257_008414 [Aspergillus nanangensis]|uniref:HECT-type E3 ubiquitin transferase n=1 Tax=Aspergillus nanangensis TaxID=2582783 RepID=A0AAD4GTI0_ASPNN|nr:hypothetical protein FE257_008414 [Aspergillus nanangensis]